ncbi:MAG TPA: SIR2 family protein [Blastocatellia bacterium]|nr:SIR2 family protein [Blastocatellia bacterium]
MERLVRQITPWGISEGVVPDVISIVDSDDAWQEREVLAVQRELGEKRFNRLVSQIRRNSDITSVPQLLALALEIVGRESTERAELARLLHQKRFPELAEFCRDRLGAGAFYEQVRRALVPKRGVPPTHRHIVRTPFSCIVTTNFDTLLEQAYTDYSSAGTPRAPTGAELTQLGTMLIEGSFFVLKAHGDALRPETMVFSTNDYRRMIHATPAFQAVFSSILMTHALLFVGYSLNDTNFRLLLDQQFTVFSGQVPPRYALLSGVGVAEEEILWRTARVQILSYPEGQHHHVEQFLEELANATAQEPAKALKPQAAPPGSTKARRKSRLATTLSTGISDGQLFIELTRPVGSRTLPQAWASTVSAREMESLAALITTAIDAHSQRESAAPEIASVGDLLARLVPSNLLRRLRALTTGSPVRLACSQGTHRIPWEWLPINGQPLCLRHAVVRCPISLSDTARGYRAFKGRGRALIIGDAGSGQPPIYPLLPGAKREAAEIVKRLRRRLPRGAVTHLSREAATRNRILKELGEGDYDIFHFGGHAWFTDRESYFWAWDSLMLGSELTPLLSRRPPSLLVMSTHFTSFVPWGGNEDFRSKLVRRSMSLQDLDAQLSSDFAEVAMRCGVAAFVGSFGEPPDLDSADAMIAFYEALLSGDSVATALLSARRRRYRLGRTSSLMLTVTGYGDLKIVT